MSFHNVRLPKCIELGVEGGPGFKTSIIETASGHEYRNIDWSRTRGRWQAGFQRPHEENELVIAFFYARRGRAYGFRFRDWSDYKVNNVFAVGDGVTRIFQAAKIYGSGEYQYVRPLTRLVAPIAVKVDGAERTASVDLNNGQVSFLAAPADGALISIHGEFDVPVRFDTDDLSIVMITADVSSIDAPIIEIRDKHG